MKWAIYALGALLLVGGLILSAYALMPDKASWAEDFTQYSQSLPEDASLRKQMRPLLADGKLSLWELSQLHCEFKTTCAIDSFMSTFANPQASDMFAQLVLQILKARDSQASNGQQ